MTTRARSQGMTLIEVLVALTLLSLLSAGLVSGFRLGQRTFEQVTAVGSAAADLDAVQRFLRTALASTYPFERSADTAARERFGLEGGRESLAFSAPAPQALGYVGHYRYELALVAAAGGKKDLRLRAGLDRNGSFEARVDETLIEDVAAVEWSYRAAADGSEWTEAWRDRRSAPALIRLRVAFASDDSRRWPDLVAAPRITTDANCEFDVVSQACRGDSR